MYNFTILVIDECSISISISIRNGLDESKNTKLKTNDELMNIDGIEMTIDHLNLGCTVFTRKITLTPTSNRNQHVEDHNKWSFTN